MMDKIFYNRALGLLLAQKVLPQMPDSFTISDLSTEAAKHNQTPASGYDLELLTERIKMAMTQVAMVEGLEIEVKLTDQNRPITTYTRKTP